MARLEQAQEGLLVTAVEAIRGLPREERDSFLVVETSAGDFLMHPHSSVQPRILASDVDMLARYGLVNLHYNRSGDRLFDVTPEGFEYYEDLRRNADEPVEAIEMTVRRYLDSADFASRHAASYDQRTDGGALPIRRREVARRELNCTESEGGGDGTVSGLTGVRGGVHPAHPAATIGRQSAQRTARESRDEAAARDDHANGRRSPAHPAVRRVARRESKSADPSEGDRRDGLRGCRVSTSANTRRTVARPSRLTPRTRPPSRRPPVTPRSRS